MAMIDYGSIVKKNNEIIQKEMFMNLCDFLNCKEEDLSEDLKKANGNYFGFVGDKDFLVALYKECFTIFINGKKIDLSLEKYNELLNGYIEDYDTFFGTNFLNDKIKNIILYSLNDERINYIHLEFFNGDDFKAYFGYGIDVKYDTQLKIAGTYGMDRETIERISDFWGKPVYVKKIKLICRFKCDKKDKRARSIKYIYGKYKQKDWC